MRFRRAFKPETLRIFDDHHCYLGESIRWDCSRQRVLWLDIKSKLMFGKVNTDATPTVLSFDGYAGAIVFLNDHEIGLTYANGLFTERSGELFCREVFHFLDVSKVRMNDARVDPFGN